VNERVRNAIHSGVKFGGAYAVINLVRNLPVVITASLPASFLIPVALVSFAAVGGLAFVLVMLGVTWATPKSPNERILSTWFVWMVAAALAAFVVGILLKLDVNSFVYWGSLGAAVWAVIVLAMWVAFRLREARRSEPAARTAEREPTR
jgi:hypothetical protein